MGATAKRATVEMAYSLESCMQGACAPYPSLQASSTAISGPLPSLLLPSPLQPCSAQHTRPALKLLLKSHCHQGMA